MSGNYDNDVEQQKIIAMVLNKDTKGVEDALTGKYSDMFIYSTLHNNCAKIAVIQRDMKTFQVIDHHPRELLCHFAPKSEDLKFVLECYKETKWEDRSGVASYIWEGCSLESAIMLREHIRSWKYGDEDPDNYTLVDCCPDVQSYFNYIPELDYSDE
tara:strand:+ start:32669 stop:33139 length:471 start_codon:yes stop_codon:yes gene_type:complete